LLDQVSEINLYASKKGLVSGDSWRYEKNLLDLGEGKEKPSHFEGGCEPGFHSELSLLLNV